MAEKKLLEKRSLLNISKGVPEREDNIPEVVNIILLGKTGSGKSATGNTILEESAFPTSSDFDSCTKTVQLETLQEENITWNIMDTPGLFDTEEDMNNDEIFAEIVKAAFDFSDGVHVFVIICRCDVRFTNEERETFLAIEKWFGPELYKYCLLVLTHANQLDEDKTLEALIGGAKSKLREIAYKVSGQVIAIDNSKTLSEHMAKMQRALIFSSLRQVIHRVNGKPYPHSLFKNVRIQLEIERIRIQNLAVLEEYIIQNYFNLLEEMSCVALSKLKTKREINSETLKSLTCDIKEKGILYIEPEDIQNCAIRITEKFPSAVDMILQQKRQIQNRNKGDTETLEDIVLQHISGALYTLDTESLTKVLYNNALPQTVHQSIHELESVKKLPTVTQSGIEHCIAQSIEKLKEQAQNVLNLKQHNKKKMQINNHLSTRIEKTIKRFIRGRELRDIQNKEKLIRTENIFPEDLLRHIKDGLPEHLRSEDNDGLILEVCYELLEEKQNSLLLIIKREIQARSSCWGFVRHRLCVLI